MKKYNLFLTCEHATNFIPSKYGDFFKPQILADGPWGRKKIKEVLSDHWGQDIGALNLAKFLQKNLKTTLLAYPVSRLLIEGNRYRYSSFFSVLTDKMNLVDKNSLIKKYWQPHANAIASITEKGRKKAEISLHVAVHSFTPIYKSKERKCDIGILFNPKRPSEKAFALELQSNLRKNLPGLIIRRNYPYSGVTLGLTTYFRKRFSNGQYAGIELEVNNKYLLAKNKRQKELFDKISKAIQNSI